MQVGQFPASAANSLIQGYCDDFISLAAVMAQTLEQVSIRGIKLDQSRPALERIERGMSALSSAIRDMLDRGVAGPQKAPASAEPPRARTPASAAPAAPASAAPTVRPAAGPQPPRPTVRPTTTPPPAPAPAAGPIASSLQRAEQPVRPRTAPLKPGRPAAVVVPAASPDSRREALRGTNKSMPLLSVFQFLGRMRKSGTMHVYIRGEILAFEFANGCIQSTASDLCPAGERLGELLVELGFCSRAVLEPVLAMVGVSAAYRLGHYCVENGIASNGQVLEGLEEQVKRRFQRVCSDPDASYEFEEGRRPPGDGRIRIAPFELAFEPTRIS